MPKIRVLVVDDSPTTRYHLVEVLRSDPELEVCGGAEDGKRAIELCRTLRPDVITLDMVLPIMSGVAITEYVMAYCPTPILIVSSSTNRGELHKTYDALVAGAVDVFEKPTGTEPDGVWERELISRVKLVSRVSVITHIRGKLSSSWRPAVSPANVESHSGAARKHIITIGGSTGAPAAIVEILRGLPIGFSIPILLVIHIGVSFSAAFAEWLNGQSRLRVRYATDGEPLPTRGQVGVVMAPPGFHLVVGHRKLRVTCEPERNSCRPSVDVLFESLAQEHGPDCVACLLTGMGRDGAAGLLALRRAGALTIAQDEASCVIFGMPREAIEMGAVDRILSLDQIAGALAAATCETQLRSKS
ncbi:MAG: two-component system, chemotaxis family, protein-glutamate methylesterase/glutaminase [Gammaproteobacteria bacterium]|jgi:two-component system chemotaxis response regulator CheB|nr:two-component system, chemotaxis family, protein-glutamate methylesterase/glutaminase [Gammaproteobacteria bacterium]